MTSNPRINSYSKLESRAGRTSFRLRIIYYRAGAVQLFQIFLWPSIRALSLTTNKGARKSLVNEGGDNELWYLHKNETNVQIHMSIIYHIIVT